MRTVEDILDDRTDVLVHLAEYLHRSKDALVAHLAAWGNPRLPLAELWKEKERYTPADFNDFYQNNHGFYLPDLVAFNVSPNYWLRINLALKVSGRVVDFGGGLGTLSIALAQQGCDVTYIDLPSPQREFAEWRFKKLGLCICALDSLEGVGAADCLDAVDVMEHLHPKVLPGIIADFARIVRKGGTVNTINDFGTQADLPQHQNTEQQFYDLMRQNGFFGGSVRWLKS